MEMPEGYSGPKLEIILRDPNSKEPAKAMANYQQFYEALLPDKEELKGNIVEFTGETINGSFCNEFNNYLHKRASSIEDATKFF